MCIRDSNRPVRHNLIRDRIKAAGRRVGVPATPHRLRHTYATQLLNAGCRVTTIQRLLGHRRLNSTMLYARVHDRTVAEDYYAAMAQVENRLAAGEADPHDEHSHLLALLDRLAEPRLELEERLWLVAQVRRVVEGQAMEPAGPQWRSM